MSLNSDQIIKIVGQIKKRMNDVDIIELRNTNKVLYEVTLMKEFEKFSDDYISLFRKIIKGEDLAYLAKMLYFLDQIKNKKIDQADGNRVIEEELQQQYLIPKLAELEKKDKEAIRPTKDAIEVKEISEDETETDSEVEIEEIHTSTTTAQ